MKTHIVVTGLMGAGKTSVADQLGLTLGRPVRDSDRDIEALTESTGAVVAREQSVASLHRLEAQVLLSALASSEPLVIAAAASVVEADECFAALKVDDVFVVVLTTTVAELVRRSATGDHRRPLQAAEVSTLLERRQPMFDDVADLTVRNDGPMDTIVQNILVMLDSPRS